MFKLLPIGGLGNRLRAILSYRALHGEIEVLWANSDAVHKAWLLDVFEPLTGVHFTYAGEGHAHDVKLPHDVMTSSPAPDAPGDWTKGFMDLRPKLPIQGQIDHHVKSGTADGYGDFIAVHARRGDHIPLLQKRGYVTSNEELLSWAIPYDRHLYLATDCLDTFLWFQERMRFVWGNKIPERVHGYEKRPGTLADAVVDLYCCVAAKAFKGTWYSTFSEVITIMRNNGVCEGGFSPERDMPSMLEHPKVPA
jgi:hypothetical protein